MFKTTSLFLGTTVLMLSSVASADTAPSHVDTSFRVTEGVNLIPVAGEVDLFAGEQVLTSDVLRSKSGGTQAGFDISNLGVNISTTTGVVEGNSADGSVTGAISDNAISNNSGFTTVFINSGNNVLFQNTLQVNVFAGAD